MLGCLYYIWVNYWCTSSLMITLKITMVLNQYYYALILIVWYMKLKLKIFMKILVKVKKCLILVIIHLSQNIMMIQTN